MTIPVMPDFALHPTAESLAPERRRMPERAFASLLTSALQRDGNTPEGQVLKQPRSVQEAAVMILQIQQQVNDHLFRALGTDDNVEPWRSSLPGAPWQTGLPQADVTPAGPVGGTPVQHVQASTGQRRTQINDALPAGEELGPIIAQAATAYGVDEQLIRSVIKAESNFVANSTSPRGAMGLMQLMPDTARELGVRNAYDPRENIMGGTKYLKDLLNRYGGDTRRALAAYNWGMGNVEKNPGRLPQETRDYIARITRYYEAAKA